MKGENGAKGKRRRQRSPLPRQVRVGGDPEVRVHARVRRDDWNSCELFHPLISVYLIDLVNNERRSRSIVS